MATREFDDRLYFYEQFKEGVHWKIPPTFCVMVLFDHIAIYEKRVGEIVSKACIVIEDWDKIKDFIDEKINELNEPK